MTRVVEGEPRVALLVARFNGLVTGQLLSGARRALTLRGVQDVVVQHCAGAWELPLLARGLVDQGAEAPTGMVALGCVIRGETPHFDYVAGEAVRGLGQVAADSGIPITLGVLTTDTVEQALARVSGTAHNKGWEAALTLLDVLEVRA